MKLENFFIKKNNGTIESHCEEQIIASTYSLVIRNRFTLVGTIWDPSIYTCFGLGYQLPFHQGYSTIGVIESSDMQGKFSVGDKVLYSPQFSKYTCVGISELQKNNIVKINCNIDEVFLLFIPIIYTAIEITNIFQGKKWKKCTIIGGSIMGAVICNVLVLWEIEVKVVRHFSDMEKEIFLCHGASEVLTYANNAYTFSKNDEEKIIILNDKLLNESAPTDLGNIIGVPCVNYGMINRSGVDFFDEVGNYIRDYNFCCRDLIAHHTHVEYCSSVQNGICNNLYMGRAVVYDW